MLCFPLLYLLLFGGNYHTAENAFWKKKIVFVIFKDCCWMWVVFFWCVWALGSSNPAIMVRSAPGVVILALSSCVLPEFCQGMYHTAEQLFGAIVWLRVFSRSPSPGSPRTCNADILVMPCPWSPHMLFFLCTYRFPLSAFVRVFWGLHDWSGNWWWIMGIRASLCRMGNSTQTELDMPGSDQASIVYYTGSPVWLIIGISWRDWKNTVYAGFTP